MTDDLISADVRDFILKHIDSVAQLEALLLIRKERDKAWSAADAAGRLYISEAAAGEIFAWLVAIGLCSVDGGIYRYAPGPELQAKTLDALSATYARYLIPVTGLIHEKPSQIQKFADAFRFRKDK